MKHNILGIAATLSLPLLASVSTSAAVALPLVASSLAGSATSAQHIRSDCRWVDNKWTYQKGDKRLVCRPDRPQGKGWGWHSEGNRQGWYHAGRKAWHNLAW